MVEKYPDKWYAEKFEKLKQVQKDIKEVDEKRMIPKGIIKNLKKFIKLELKRQSFTNKMHKPILLRLRNDKVYGPIEGTIAHELERVVDGEFLIEIEEKDKIKKDITSRNERVERDEEILIETLKVEERFIEDIKTRLKRCFKYADSVMEARVIEGRSRDPYLKKTIKFMRKEIGILDGVLELIAAEEKEEKVHLGEYRKLRLAWAH